MRAGNGERGVGRRRRRRGTGDRRTTRRRSRRSGGCRRRRHRDRVVARQLRARPRSGRRPGRTPAGDVSQRDARDDEPGAAAGRRRAAVQRADAGDLGQRRSGGAAVRRAGSRRGAGLRSRPRRARRRSPRSCAGSTGCRWRSSSPPPGCTRSTSPRSPPAWIAASSCCRRAIARPRATGRSTRRCRGRSTCSIRPCSDLRRPLGLRRAVPSRRGGRDLRRRRRRRDGRTRAARRALARDARSPAPFRAARDAARVRRRAARRRRHSSARRRAPRTSLRGVGGGRRPPGVRDGRRLGAHRDRRHPPRAARRAGLAPRSRRGRARRAPGHAAARLRLPASPP